MTANSTPSQTSLPSEPSREIQDAEITRLKQLITAARAELQYATVSNCPLHWIRVAQEILAKADKP